MKIFIEGISGSGKSTIVDYLSKEFNIPSLKFPTDFLKKQIQYFRHGKRNYELEARLFYVDWKNIESEIGENIITDRSYFTSIADNGYDLFHDCIKPDALIIIDVDPIIAHTRIKKRTKSPTKTETLEHLIKLRENFLDLKKYENSKIIKNENFEKTLTEIKSYLKKI